MSRAFLAVLLVAILTAPCVVDASSSCSTLSDCVDCTAAECYWCDIASACIDHAAVSGCPGQVANSPGTCPGACKQPPSALSTCYECTASCPGHYVWCESANQCLDSAGASGCPGQYVNSTASCPGACQTMQPSTLTSCGDCTSTCAGDFVWCEASNLCMSKLAAPGSCPSKYVNTTSACPGACQTMQPSTLTSCDACTSTCPGQFIWCDKAAVCMEASTSASCPSHFTNTTAQCPGACQELPPSTLTSCTSCTSTCPGQFVWCDKANDCMEATTASSCPSHVTSTPATCPGACQTLQPSTLTTCDACTSTCPGQFVWCDKANACMEASMSKNCPSHVTNTTAMCPGACQTLQPSTLQSCTACTTTCPGQFAWCDIADSCLEASLSKNCPGHVSNTSAACPGACQTMKPSTLLSCNACTSTCPGQFAWCVIANSCIEGTQSSSCPGRTATTPSGC